MNDNSTENKKNLLIIDDEVEITKSLFRQFRRKYKVHTAISAEDALPILEKETIRVILSDQRMPGMSGTDFFNVIKDKYPDSVKMILTGYTDIEAVINAVNDGQVFRFLTKPWHPNELELAIEEAFEKFELIAENKILMRKLEEANSILEKKVEERTKELLDHKNNLELIIKKRTSELENSKEKAEESDRLKSAFLANISHEIRTPMNAIVGFSNLLSKTITESRSLAYIDSIQTNAKNLLILIGDILDLSEIEAGNMGVNKEWVETKKFFEEIIQIFDKEISDSTIDFKFEIKSTFPSNMLIDIAKIRQIIVNLLSNAIKFTHQGFVKLGIEYDDHSFKDNHLDLKLVVEDSGIGIPSEFQKKLFIAFSQQDDQSIRKYGGTGLGLALCQRLVQIIKGTIEVSSEVNKGTRFTVILPKIEVENKKEIKHQQFLLKENKIQEVKPTSLPEQTLTLTEKQALIDLLNGDLKNKWKGFANQQPMKKVKIFALELQKLTVKYPHPKIIFFTHNLLEAVDTFDIVNLLKLLKAYPGLILDIEAEE